MADRRPKIIGSSKGLREVLARAARVARTAVAVLIEGESGTGKELLAQHIHDLSPRAAGPLVTVNCAAIPKDLLESELFGHERGAFTGALAMKIGAFDRAHGGTLFLDEIGDMALDHQAKVLRAIQEGEIQRVGGNAPRKVDVRIVAATHRDLPARTAEGSFREDLYYRLAGYTLRLPPLRERGRDIVAIAKALLAREFPAKFLSRAAQALLLGYAWPGNVRELENVVRAAAIDARGRRISEKVVLAQPAFAGVAKPVTGPSAAARLTAVRAFLEQRGRIAAADVRATVHLQKAQAHRLLAAWERRGEIERRGAGRSTYYVAIRGAEAARAARRCG
ncbi:MAG: sigma-54-dependent Fis family transcriptional regulator [Deltaproteobacteria bacterium]|nr:sigma-54-dependent Fis family transcriptional regulator [Deltaproteobacteria bacterium]